MAKSQTRQDATRTRQKNKLPSPPKEKEEKLFAGEEPLYDSRRGTPWPRSETLGIMDEIGKYIEKAKGYIPSEEERQEIAEDLIAQYEDAGLNVPPELLSSIGTGELLSMAGESLPTKGEDIETEVLLSMLGGPKIAPKNWKQADMFDDLLAKLFKDEAAGTMYPPAVGTDEYEELYDILQKRKALSKATDPTGKRVGDKNPLRAVLEEESDEMKARRKYPELWENPNERIR
mgnify:FL=1|tara:strand:- start:2853 stop:3548 length:696 start_codon:yes stop_codon:yes gene_type:complete